MNRAANGPETWGNDMRRLTLTLAVAIGLLATMLATPASAAYIGSNGRLAFVRANQIYTVAPSGQAEDQLTSVGKNIRPKWSPDGRRIAYVKETADGSRDVWVMSATGTNKTRVTDLGNVTTEPTWSPDGTTLAFAADDFDNPAFSQLYTINSTEPFGSPTPIQGYLTDCSDCPLSTDPPSADLQTIYVDRFLAWSPDGSRIAVFNHDEGEFDSAIYMFYVATGESREFRATGADCCGSFDFTDLAWGPGGQFGYGLANTGEDGSDPFVGILYPDPKSSTDAPFVPAKGDKSPAPSPSGTRMAFTNSTSGRPNIYVATVTGENRRVVTNGYEPDWQPLP
jgi:Tol biopolymer transport system component